LTGKASQYAGRFGLAEARTDRRKGGAVHAAACPAGRFDANGGDSPRQRPLASLPAQPESA